MPSVLKYVLKEPPPWEMTTLADLSANVYKAAFLEQTSGALQSLQLVNKKHSRI